MYRELGLLLCQAGGTGVGRGKQINYFKKEAPPTRLQPAATEPDPLLMKDCALVALNH